MGGPVPGSHQYEILEMKTHNLRDGAESAILAALPGRANDVARLRVLAESALPVVTVIGKYNHGKSRLLNEMIGYAAFAVADKRETIALAEHVHDGVCWLDAPGLDADVHTADDDHALRAIWLQSDIRLFVHAAKEGELDATERSLLESLRQDGQRTLRQTLFATSQVDQLANEQLLQEVLRAIGSQAPDFELHLVSSTRYRQGLESGKALLLQRSGIPALKRALQHALNSVPKARAHETALLLGEARAELAQLRLTRQGLLAGLCEQQAQQRRRFDGDLLEALDKARTDIQVMLDAPGPDHSRTPDSFATQFKVTAGKLDRNRLQVAYSKVCIFINSVLIQHGVTELPLAQQTSVRSLDNVMVAVMGVYIKYRKDLKAIFCESAGRERLQREFSRYFKLSVDRMELASRIADSEADVRTAQKGLAALDNLSNLQVPT